MLLIALGMSFSDGIEIAFDPSVFESSKAAFAIATMKEIFMEVMKN